MSRIPPASQTASPPRRAAALLLPLRLFWRSMKWCARLGLGLLLAAWGLILVAWLALHWGILPHIEQWRGPLETQASRALGVPVKLGRIEVRSTGWVPSFALSEVSFLDPQGRPALVLPRVTAAVSPQSLLRFELRFEQLVVDGAHLEIRRDASGRIFVAGLSHSSGDAGRRAADWLLRQHEVVVRNGSVRWVDEQRGAPPLLLSDLLLVVRGGFRRHEMRLDATPPPGWGQRLSLRGRFTQPLLARAAQWERWTGQTYADLPEADVRELGRYIDLPFELKEGRGALRGWSEWRRGQAESATLDLALREVSARLSPELEPLQLSQAQGRLQARRSASELRFEARQLGFTTQDGLHWPAADVAVKLQQRPGAAVTGGQVTAGAFDLRLLSQIATRLPLGDAANQLLRETAPQGQLRDLDLRWQGQAKAPATYQLRGRLQGLSLAAKPAADNHGVGRPGVHNANLDIEASQAGGSARLSMADGRIELPGVFAESEVPLHRFSADLSWRIEPVKDGTPRLALQWNRAQFANADMQGEVSGSWRTGDGPPGFGKGQRLPGRLQLDGKLSEGDLSKVARYLPQRIPEPVRDYLSRALYQGRMSQVSVRVQGDLAEFPFAKARSAAEGEFRIAGKVRDAALAYVPSVPARGDTPAWVSSWPAFTDLGGEVAIDRDQLDIRNAQARVMGVALGKVNGEVRDLSQKGRTTLRIAGEGRGELSSMLRFVETSPVGRWTGHALGRATVGGLADLKLNLTLPVFDLPSSAVKGSVALLGNDLRLQPEVPLLGSAQGRVDFSNTGFAIVGASARFLGGEATFSGGTQPDRSVRVTGQGVASAEAVRGAPELGALSRLANYFSGQATYRLDLGVVGGHTEVNLGSNLVGWASQLPAPLGKPAEAALPMRFQTRLSNEPPTTAGGETPPGAARPVQDSLRLDVGSVLQAQYIREWPADDAQAPPRVLSGALGVGATAPPPPPGGGVAARLALPAGAVNLDEWSAVAGKVLGSGSGAGTDTGASEPAVSSGWNNPSGYVPTQLQVQAQELVYSPMRLNDLDAQARWDSGEWRVSVDARQTRGEILWRPASAQQAGRVHARLSRLSIGAPPGGGGAAAEAPAAANGAHNSGSVPALDVVVDDFELRGRRLGRLEVQASHAGGNSGGAASRGPAATEWQMQRLALTTPEARLSATGHWQAAGGAVFGGMGGAGAARKTQMDFKLEVDDAGALLERLGHAKTVRGGKGELAGQLAWNGSPFSPDPLSMSGQMTVDMGSGQFLRAEPGAARLLGVLSLQSLPRRLLLDFRDVFQDGFAFDNLTGNVGMTQGVASTNNLRMRGVQAAVLMEGQASLVDETQDLRVVVVPEINAGTASLAYAVINPALGLGSFLAQMFLRKPLTEANTREFHVTGPWADPKVTRVQHGLPEAAEAASGPAQGAPAASSGGRGNAKP